MNTIRSRLADLMLYGLLPLAAAVFATWVYGSVFGTVPRTTDESSYVAQAHRFLAGRITRPVPPFPGAFQNSSTMMIMDDEVGWMSRYSPGHPLWLMPGCWLGWPHAMSALAAALTVIVMSRVGALFGAPMAWLTGVLTALSPWFLFTHGTLLSHTSGLLAAALLLYGFLRWQLTGSVGSAAVGGLGWAWLYTIRTYTATLVVLPFAAVALLALWRQRRNPVAWRGTVVFAVCAGAGAVVVFGYNALALGDPFTMTYLYYQPEETPGFGTRRFFASTNTFTPAKALENFRENLILLDHWLFGFKGSLAMALGLAAVGWRRCWTPLLLACPLLVMGGYFLFWYPGPQECGPGYYLETLPFLMLAAAFGLARLWAWRTHPAWRAGWCLLAAVAIAADGTFMLGRARVLQAENREAAAANRLLRTVPPGALVVLRPNIRPYVEQRAGAFLVNPQGLDSDPLLVWSLEESDPLLGRVFSDRKPYQLVPGDPPALVPLDWQGKVFDVTRDCCETHYLRGVKVSDESGRCHLIVRSDRDRAGWMAFGNWFHLAPGAYIAEFDVQVTEAAANQAVLSIDVACDSGKTVLAQRTLAGTVAGRQALAFHTDRADAVELRAEYMGEGNVELRAVRVRDANPAE